MNSFAKFALLASFPFLIRVGWAEKSSKGMKIGDIDTNGDTTIQIKKGVGADATCVSYEVVDSNEDIEGEEKYDRGDALKSWKEACEEWKKSFKELNVQNGIISMTCGKSQITHGEGFYRVSSTAKYKVKVRMKEKVVPGN